MTPPGAAPGACKQCRLPLRSTGASDAQFCCSGCLLAWSLLGRESSDGGRADGLLARVVVSAFLSMGVMVFSLSLYGIEGEVGDEASTALQGVLRMGALLLSLPVLVLLGVPLADGVVRLKRWFSADALALIGVLAAWAVSSWNTLVDGPSVYFETATMVLVLVTFGRWMDARARERATDRLRVLAAERTPAVTRLDATGELEQEVEAEAISVGDLVRLRPGELVAVDGDVIEGRSFVDAGNLTGEAEPASVGPGDRVLAGSSVVDGTLLLRATAGVGNRVRDEIDRLLSESLTARPRLVHLADRVAAGLLPVVVVLALATIAWHWDNAGPERALMNGLSVVLIACPCALGLATPLAFWVGLGEAWRRGALVRGSDVLERLARVREVFLDKTGTLTDDRMQLVGVERIDTAHALDDRQCLAVAAALERGSEHPVGRAIRTAARERSVNGLDLEVRDFRARPGVGVEAQVDGRAWTLGRPTAARAAVGGPDGATEVLLADAEGEVARLSLVSRLRLGAREAVAALRRSGLSARILTGDTEAAATALGRELDLPVEARLLPPDKARRVARAGAEGLFVGDGLNDAPALAAAGVGVSMGHASPSSLESASVNLLGADLRVVPEVLELARRAVATARLNLFWAFAYNAVGLVLAAMGVLTPVFAATAMVVSSVLVVLNSARLRASAGQLEPLGGAA